VFRPSALNSTLWPRGGRITRCAPTTSSHDRYATARVLHLGFSTRDRDGQRQTGLHHVWARVYKDSSVGIRPCRGVSCHDGGLDTHGLPVEVQVEKTTGHLGSATLLRKSALVSSRGCVAESVLI